MTYSNTVTLLFTVNNGNKVTCDNFGMPKQR
jgi:hypothetical protein